MYTRFEFKSDKSNKFWIVSDPILWVGGNYGITVKFGKIGTIGQSHSKIFTSQKQAAHYRASKQQEKVAKGYKFISNYVDLDKAVAGAALVVPKKNGLLIAMTPAMTAMNVLAINAPLVKKACEHALLRKLKPGTWQCSACGDKIEFDKPAVADLQIPTMQAARRFFVKPPNNQ
jgi:predicted DNA-binding WGR domain protein